MAPRWPSRRLTSRFRAKLRDIVISVLSASGQPLAGPALEWHLNLMDELCDHFLDAYLEKAKVSRDRVLLWETCDLLTAMLYAWTKVRLLRIDPRMTVLKHHLEKHSMPEKAVGSVSCDNSEIYLGLRTSVASVRVTDGALQGPQHPDQAGP